jgi:hypothetical protein
MKTPLAALAAAAIPMLLSPLPLTADEPQFNVPATVRAQESAELLRRAAHALRDMLSDAALQARGQHIANLWLFPTGDADTVFAQYTLMSNDDRASTTQRLALLTLRGDRIVDLRELTAPEAASSVGEVRAPTGASSPVTR